MGWTELEGLARSLPPKTNLVIPKEVVAHPPPFSRSRLGRKRGALRQYRCDRRSANLHLKEYHDRWVLHVDNWNPHRHPFRHLLVDHGYKVFVHLAHLLESRAPTPTPVAEAS